MDLGNIRVLALLGFISIYTNSVNGITRRDDQPDSLYLSLGASPEYDCVGKLSSTLEGSAVLIAPDWVLTAAHNLVAASSATFTVNDVTYSSSQVFRNPGWNGNAFNGYDFGLVHLSTPVLNVTPATLYGGVAEIGQVATLLGFGMQGTGLTGYQNLDYQKRGCQNVIDGNFGNPAVLLGCDFDNPNNPADNGFGDATPLNLEGAVAFGDSGGGVFITEGSTTYLAGIISFIAASDGSANSDYGDVSGFGRISAATPWIMSIVPEPSTVALTAAGGIVFGWTCSRRKSQKVSREL